MEIKNINGNLLDTDAELILHQVNCQGKMNSGVAKAIRTKWPIVYENYLKLVNERIYSGEKYLTNKSLLGVVQPVKVSDTQKVLNLFGQDDYGYDGKQYTSYDAINTCFRKVSQYCSDNGYKSIALPYKMCSDRGGANWNIIVELLKDNFNDKDITVEIWKLKD